MEVYILDSLLRPVDVVDVFVSLIWTERFSSMGDFELITSLTSSNQKRFVPDTILSIPQSRRLMKIEIVEETISESDGPVLKIKGFEISKITDSRIAMKALGAGGVAPVWLIPDMTPANIMRHIFQQICVLGTLDTADIIPFIDTAGGNLYPADSIPEPSGLIDWEQKPATVYAALKELGDIYDLGHRLYKDPNLAKLYFNVYAGSDRTSAQTTLPAVIFSSEMETLQNTTEYTDLSKYYNMVQVVYTFKDENDNDSVITMLVTDDALNPPQGFDRRIKPLVVTSVPEEITDVVGYLFRLGIEELMKSRPLSAFDGEINPNSQYRYERDYYLGDLVETRNRNGSRSYMRVEEYIFVEDAEGERSYPTLAVKEYFNPGTWNSWKYDIEWSAMGSEEYWANQ